MRRRHGIIADMFQILLSLGIIGMTVLLILDWKTYDICFCLSFGLAVVLFFTRGVCAMMSDSKKKSRFGAAAAYFLITVFFVSMFTGSVLTMFFI